MYVFIKAFESIVVTYNKTIVVYSFSNENQAQKVTTALDFWYFNVFVSVAAISLVSDIFPSLASTQVK